MNLTNVTKITYFVGTTAFQVNPKDGTVIETTADLVNTEHKLTDEMVEKLEATATERFVVRINPKTMKREARDVAGDEWKPLSRVADAYFARIMGFELL